MLKRLVITVMLVLIAASARASEEFLSAEEKAKLQPIAGVEGVARYSPSGKLARDYEKMLIGSVTFFFSDKSKSKDIDADEMKQISDAMKQALVTVCSKNWQIVPQPGSGIVQVNLAITNIELKHKKRGLLGYTPAGLVVTTTANLAGMRLRLASAQLQGEFLDSDTGELINVFAVEKIGEFDDEKGMSWDDVRLALQDAATRATAR